jgi:hypothetical protein
MRRIEEAALLIAKRVIWKHQEWLGYDRRDWARIILYEKCNEFLNNKIDRARARVLAISSANYFEGLGFTNFTATSYPQFDICSDVMEGEYDLIIADQVFEHLEDPEQAARNVFKMLSVGGWFLISTPFMIRIHLAPIDCYRWTQMGLVSLLSRAGFHKDAIETGQWGNRSWIVAHMKNQDRWPIRGFGSLRNEPKFPVVVWAFACKY